MILYSSFFFFFFKQKTAYEMRISDWSSDVCSSDLHVVGMTQFAVADTGRLQHAGAGAQHVLAAALVLEDHPAARHVDHLELELVAVPGARTLLARHRADHVGAEQIGRASCRERVGQSV